MHRYLRTDYRGAAGPYEVGCSVEHWIPAKAVTPPDGSTWLSRKPNPRHTLVLWSPDPALLNVLPTHDNARDQSLRLVTEASGLHPTRLFMHGPIAQSRSWQLEIEARFPDHYARTGRSKFRSSSDLEPIWLHHYLGYVEGRTVPGSLRYEYISLADTTASEWLAQLAVTRRPHVFCINDDGAAPLANIEAIRQFLPQ